MAQINPDDLAAFKAGLNKNRYDFCRLVYHIFPFGQKGHELEAMAPYDWQMEEWEKLSKHLTNPETRYELYRLIISSGNGAAKTAFGAMTILMLMYTQQLRARITANTDPQMKATVWPEYDIWFRNARYSEVFFEKFGTSIKARNPKFASTWRTDTFTWSEEAPAAISGLHNKGRAVSYVFEEAPGIPAKIFEYANGAFGDTLTIKIWMAFGNSDDPTSKFEQLMSSPLWHSKRIDTRTLGHMDKSWIDDLLRECNGNEDHDDFRVRVRGLPRKTAKDSIISTENVSAAIERGKHFDAGTVASLPCLLTCDPAWQGGDETVIAMRQGHHLCVLEKYKLDRSQKENHTLTFQKLCHYEKDIGADAVFIDQGEGTGIYSMAQNAGKTSWFLISFANKPTDTPESKDSEYANIRAQMYHELNKLLIEGGVLTTRDPDDLEITAKQLTWARGSRHKVTMKKTVEPKVDIKDRVGQSPDIADALVLTCAMQVTDRLPENAVVTDADGNHLLTGQSAYKMPEHDVTDLYDIDDVTYSNLYD
jgi:hypothetical protein